MSVPISTSKGERWSPIQQWKKTFRAPFESALPFRHTMISRSPSNRSQNGIPCLMRINRRFSVISKTINLTSCAISKKGNSAPLWRMSDIISFWSQRKQVLCKRFPAQVELPCRCRAIKSPCFFKQRNMSHFRLLFNNARWMFRPKETNQRRFLSPTWIRNPNEASFRVHFAVENWALGPGWTRIN